MIIKAKRLEVKFDEDKPKQFARIPCQFHMKSVDYLEAEPKEEWANPDRPETRVVFRTGHEYVIQFHYSTLSKLHAEYNKCEVITA